VAELTYADIADGRHRKAKTACCGRRPDIVLQRVDTTAGPQIVYACPGCCKLYVIRENDEVTRG